MVAIGLGFVEQVKKKLNKTIKDKEVLRKDKNLLLNLSNMNNFRSSEEINSDKFNLSNKKEKLELNISLKEVFEDKGNYFDVNLFIGTNNKYPIINIQEFIINLNKSKEYYIGKGLIYNTNKYYFSKRG